MKILYLYVNSRSRFYNVLPKLIFILCVLATITKMQFIISFPWSDSHVDFYLPSSIGLCTYLLFHILLCNEKQKFISKQFK